MVLRRETAQRIVNCLAHNLVKEISVADPAAQVIASTNANLVGVYDLLAAQAIATDDVSENGTAEVARISAPLVYNDHTVGAIVLNDAAQHGKELVQVAKALAELLIHQTNVIEQLPQQKWARDKFLSDLLLGRLNHAADVVLQEAVLLNIDLSLPRVVVVINIEQINAQITQCSRRQETLPMIAHTLRVEQLHTFLLEHAHLTMATNETDVYGFIDDRWQVILAVVDLAAVDRSRRQIAQRVQRFIDDLAQSSGVTTSAGIGHYYTGWPALARSFVEASGAFQTGSALHGAGQVFVIEELGLAGLLCSNDPLLKLEQARRLIEPLTYEPDLLATLDAFLQADLSPSLTAHKVHIHRHTLAYRLDKIAHVTGYDPRHFEDAAHLYAALVLWKTAPKPS